MILITGCAGFIGYHLSIFYLKRGKQVLGIDNINNYYSKELKLKRLNKLKKFKKFKFFLIDLKNKQSLKKIKKYRIKFIVHLAGQAGVRYSIVNPLSYVDNNIKAYINLLEFFKYHPHLVSILYASSSSVYGDKKSKIKNYNIKSVYAASKKTMEFISDIYCNIYKLKFVGMRFFTVYGPYGRPDMSIYKFFNNILEDKKIDIYNYGNHKRSFTYIDDIILNINKIVKNSDKNKYKKDSIVYNIGNPVSVSLFKLIKIIEAVLSKKVKKNLMPFQMGDVLKTKAYIGKEENRLDFKFKVNIEEGIKKFANWFLNER
jgi:UDP-glucuronate 4-epimerase